MSDTGSGLLHPEVRGVSRIRNRIEQVIVVVFHAYPLVLLASLYLTWFAGWVALGHPPRPSLDDPKYIGLLVDVPYTITMVLLVWAPGAMVTAMLARR